MNGGRVPLSRSVFDLTFSRKPLTGYLALYLLAKANHAPGTVILRNGEIAQIQKGQTLTSEYALSEATGLTYQNTRTSLKILEKAKFLTRTSTHHFTLITITDYGRYAEFEKQPNLDSNVDPTQTQRRLNAESNDKQEEEKNKKKGKKEKETGGDNGHDPDLLADPPVDSSKKGISHPIQKGKNGNVPEGIEKIRQACGRYPEKLLWPDLEKLTANLSVETLTARFKNWRFHDYRANNFSWIQFDGKPPATRDFTPDKPTCPTCHNQPLFDERDKKIPCTACGGHR